VKVGVERGRDRLEERHAISLTVQCVRLDTSEGAVGSSVKPTTPCLGPVVAERASLVPCHRRRTFDCALRGRLQGCIDDILAAHLEHRDAR